MRKEAENVKPVCDDHAIEQPPGPEPGERRVHFPASFYPPRYPFSQRNDNAKYFLVEKINRAIQDMKPFGKAFERKS
ncbi:hypothetical protein AV530_006977 [Patagioenas fasciata monilis]|uniref:Uncharacterized protein n=1 Tax=Patagioenas fasciata monilis TaxID=372326 RepID=A0A1V4KXF8_PATFA|nr:hypothetical protein AV530_006977 [Patagioenas fasciata monilis]